MACGDQTPWNDIHFTPCDMIINGVTYRPDRPSKGCIDGVPLFFDWKIRPDVDHYRRCYKDQLCPSLQQQLHEQQTKEAMTKFKKGDSVRINCPGDSLHGKDGVIKDSSGSLADVWRVSVDKSGVSYLIDGSNLTLVDQPLSTTPDKVLQAAKTSPQAKDALKALFPDVFKDEPLMSLIGVGNRIFDGVFIGSDGSYILAGEGVEVRVKEQAYGTTTITFRKKS